MSQRGEHLRKKVTEATSEEELWERVSGILRLLGWEKKTADAMAAALKAKGGWDHESIRRLGATFATYEKTFRLLGQYLNKSPRDQVLIVIGSLVGVMVAGYTGYKLAQFLKKKLAELDKKIKQRNKR